MIKDFKDTGEIELFLKDFFDEKELEKFTKRLAIVYWIKKSRNKENIRQNLKATDEEISRSKKMINLDGVKLAIKKIEAEEWANVWSQKIKNFTKS